MAVRILTANATLSTSAGSWKKAEASSLGFVRSASNLDDCNTARYTTTGTTGFSVTAGVTIQGAFLVLQTGTTLTGTFVVALEEYSGGWTQQAISANINVSDIGNVINAQNFLYIPFTSGFVASTNTFRLKVYCATGTARVFWLRTSTANAYSFAVFGDGDDANLPSSGDTIILSQNVTLTIDTNLTIGPTSVRSLFFCRDSILSAPNSSGVKTLAFGAGAFCLGTDGKINFGTDLDPISDSNRITVTNSLSFGSYIFDAPATNLTNAASKFELNLYGVESSELSVKVSADAASGQKVIDTEQAVPATWVAGGATPDKIVVVLKDIYNNADNIEYTLAAKSDNTVTLSANLDAVLLQHGAVVNISALRRLGIYFLSTNETRTIYDYYSALCLFRIQGVFFEKLSPRFYSSSYEPATGTSFCKSFGCYVNDTDAYPAIAAGLGKGGINIDDVILINRGYTYNYAFASNGLVINNLITKGLGSAYASTPFSGTNVRIDGMVWGACSSYNGLSATNLSINGGALIPFSANKASIKNVYMAGSCLLLRSGIDYELENVEQRGGALGLCLGNTKIKSAKNCTFGVLASNTVSDVVILKEGYATFSGEFIKIGSAGINQGVLSGAFDGSVFAVRHYNDTIDDHRSWTRQGYFASDSGKLLAVNTLPSESLYANYTITTNDITGAKLGISVYSQIYNAAFYAGTHQLPQLDVTYDADQTETATSASSTTRQSLSVVVSPSVNYSRIVAKLSCKTDATGTDRDVRFDTLVFNIRKYGKEFNTISKVITEIIDIPLGEIPNLTDNAFITEATGATVAAYTGISINHTTGKMTITEAHTYQEIYDYTQYDMSLEANLGLAEWFTTIDGITYDSGYDIEIDTVTVTGDGIIWDLGTNDFTGTGSFSGKIIDVDGSLVSVTVSGIVTGSRVRVEKSSDGTELYNAIAAGTSISFNYQWTTNIGINIDVRKSSAAPYYAGYLTSSTITSNGASVIVAQIPDGIRSSYPAGIADDWTINTTTNTVEATAGTTVYTVRELYSYLANYFDDSALMEFSIPMTAQTQFDFTLVSPWTISDASHERLKGGSISEDSGDVLWSNVTTVSDIVAGTQLYVTQSSTEITPWWSTGHIDILIKVKTAGSLIDSGDIVIFAREWGNTFNVADASLANGGRTLAVIGDRADTENQTAVGTVATWSDVTITEGATSKDIGDGLGSQPYSVIIDGGARPVAEIYERLKWVCRSGSTTQIRSDDGQEYRRINDLYPEVKESPFGVLAGGIFVGAQGVWLENVDTADALNYIVSDNNGVTHQQPAPPVSIAVTNIVAGSIIQVYDNTADTELDIDTVAGTSYSLEYTYPGTDHEIRVRLMYCVGTAAKLFVETIGTATVTGLAIRADQQTDNVYIANNIDGSAVTGITIDDTLMLISIDTSSLSWADIYAYETYWLSTTDGMRDEGRIITAVDTANYVFQSFQIKNIGVGPLVITGGYAKDSITGAALDIFDTSGNTIILAPDHVVPYAAGAEATVATVQAGLTAQGYTGGRAGKIDYLDAAVSSVGGPAVAVLELATAIVRTVGSDQGGTIATIQAHDDSSHATGEVAGQGLTVEITATGTDPDNKPLQCSITGYYAGSTGHYMDIQAYNYILAAWEVKGQMLTRNTPFDYTIPLSDDHISVTGELKIKLVHSASTYISAHRLYIDFVEWEVSDGQSQVGAGIAAIKNVTDQLSFTFGRVNANAQMIAGSTTAATAVEQNIATMAANLDVAVSTRNSVAPDNASITTIKTTTGFLEKIVKNKREITPDKDIVVYDDNGTTPILQKALKDSTGGEISDLTAGIMAIEEASSV